MKLFLKIFLIFSMISQVRAMTLKKEEFQSVNFTIDRWANLWVKENIKNLTIQDLETFKNILRLKIKSFNEFSYKEKLELSLKQSSAAIQQLYKNLLEGADEKDGKIFLDGKMFLIEVQRLLEKINICDDKNYDSSSAVKDWDNDFDRIKSIILDNFCKNCLKFEKTKDLEKFKEIVILMQERIELGNLLQNSSDIVILMWSSLIAKINQTRQHLNPHALHDFLFLSIVREYLSGVKADDADNYSAEKKDSAEIQAINIAEQSDDSDLKQIVEQAADEWIKQEKSNLDELNEIESKMLAIGLWYYSQNLNVLVSIYISDCKDPNFIKLLESRPYVYKFIGELDNQNAQFYNKLLEKSEQSKRFFTYHELIQAYFQEDKLINLGDSIFIFCQKNNRLNIYNWLERKIIKKIFEYLRIRFGDSIIKYENGKGLITNLGYIPEKM